DRHGLNVEPSSRYRRAEPLADFRSGFRAQLAFRVSRCDDTSIIPTGHGPIREHAHFGRLANAMPGGNGDLQWLEPSFRIAQMITDDLIDIRLPFARPIVIGQSASSPIPCGLCPPIRIILAISRELH